MVMCVTDITVYGKTSAEENLRVLQIESLLDSDVPPYTSCSVTDVLVAA